MGSSTAGARSAGAAGAGYPPGKVVAGPAGGTSAPAADAAPTFSAFQPRMLVNQRPLYSRLSMSNERVTSSPGLSMNWSARSPKKSKWTFLGKLSCVSSTYSRFFHGLPALEVPVISGRASMILPWISMCLWVCIKLELLYKDTKNRGDYI